MHRLSHFRRFAAFAGGALSLAFAACQQKPPYYQGYEQTNSNLEGSQINWMADSGFRPATSPEFLQPKCEDVKEKYRMQPSENPTPVGKNAIVGPSNPIPFARSYTPVLGDAKD